MRRRCKRVEKMPQPKTKTRMCLRLDASFLKAVGNDLFSLILPNMWMNKEKGQGGTQKHRKTKSVGGERIVCFICNFLFPGMHAPMVRGALDQLVQKLFLRGHARGQSHFGITEKTNQENKSRISPCVCRILPLAQKLVGLPSIEYTVLVDLPAIEYMSDRVDHG